MSTDGAGTTPLPPSIELAWGLRDVGSRGPKRGLTLDAVVAAGIEVALAEGVGALSMGRVAKALGVGTMSLYRYVAAKDELLVLMSDAALGPAPVIAPDAPWRDGLTAWASGVRRAYQRHPWALKVPIVGPPLGPNNLAWLEAGLRSLAATTLSEHDKLSTMLLLSGFVRNEATLSADLAAAAAGDQVMPGYGAMVRRLTDRRDYPALHRAIDSGSLDEDDDLEIEFHFGLQRILDGVAVLLGPAS